MTERVYTIALQPYKGEAASPIGFGIQRGETRYERWLKLDQARGSLAPVIEHEIRRFMTRGQP